MYEEIITFYYLFSTSFVKDFNSVNTCCVVYYTLVCLLFNIVKSNVIYRKVSYIEYVFFTTFVHV